MVLARQKPDAYQLAGQKESGFTISYEAESIQVDGAGTMAEVLFSDGLQIFKEKLADKKRLRTVLKQLLPLTAPKYDMSYA